MEHQKVILITGASSGIGAATARLFAQKGYATVLAARRMEKLEKLSQEIHNAGGNSLIVRTDVSQIEDINHLVELAIKHYGQIDILFNNAGFGKLKWLEELEPEKEVRAQVNVDVLGVMLTTQAVLPHMIQRRKGQIINIGSIASFIATPTYTIYAASKFAVRGFSEALRREVGIHGIQVSLICPGGVATEFGEIAGFSRTTKITTPNWLLLSAEDVAQGVWRLAQKPRATMILPRIMHFAIWLNSLFPGLLDWSIERLFVRRERGEVH